MPFRPLPIVARPHRPHVLFLAARFKYNGAFKILAFGYPFVVYFIYVYQLYVTVENFTTFWVNNTYKREVLITSLWTEPSQLSDSPVLHCYVLSILFHFILFDTVTMTVCNFRPNVQHDTRVPESSAYNPKP